MEKVDFINYQQPALNATNLNKLQQNAEDAIDEVQESKLDKTSVKNTYSTSVTDTYSCNYVNGLETYSTNETRVGTWINNKPIYRKVIEIGALPNNGYKGVNHNITNLDKVTKLYMIVNISDGYFYQANMQGTSGIFGGNTVVVRGNSTQIQVETTGNYSNHTGYTIIEYTKTTDA